MTCNPQTLLTDGRCFAAMNPSLLQAAIVAMWCDVAEGLSNLSSDNPALQSDDGNWYRISAVELSPGNATIQVGQVAVDPGVNPYLVIVDDDDGLKYKFRLVGAPPNVFWQIDTGATGEAETPTILYSGSDGFTLVTVGSGSTIELQPVP